MNKSNNNYTVYVKKHPYSTERVVVTISGKKVKCNCDMKDSKGKCNHIIQALEFYSLLQLAKVAGRSNNGK